MGDAAGTCTFLNSEPLQSVFWRTYARSPTRYLGKPLKRKEDPRLIQGLAHYVDDIVLPGLQHAAILRSPYAHAKIRSIDVSKAQAAPGVSLGAHRQADIRGSIGMVPCAAQIPDMKSAPRPVLAQDRVRFSGEGVAVVVATGRYAARDALDLIEVDYEPLTPVVVDPEKAIEKGSPVLYDGHKDNVAFRWELEGGDVKAAFKNADKVVKQRLVNQRLIPVPMETRGVVADYKPGERQLTVWSSTQIPHLLRTQIAAMLDVPEFSVRVITPEVGGGFGSKLNVYAEEALVGYLAMRLETPVGNGLNLAARTSRTRFTAATRSTILKWPASATERSWACASKIIADLGAYYQLLTPLIPTLTGLMASGCYKIPAIRAEITGVLTNKMSTDAYRGAGRPEATYLVERTLDLVAAELKKDPVEVRRKNFPKLEDFPYATPTGVIYDSANYPRSLDLALKLSGYTRLRQEQAEARKQGRCVGIGLSTYVEICAMGPSSAMPAGGWESATVRIEPSGMVNVMTGASPHGQGQETSFAQLGAEILGLEPDDVNVIHGDTSIVPYGIGTFGSRATAVGGTAAYKSLMKLREKLAMLAGFLIDEDPAKLVFDRMKIFSKKQPKKSIGFGEVVSRCVYREEAAAEYGAGPGCHCVL